MTVLTTIRGAFDLRRPLARIGAVLAAMSLAACEPVAIGATGPQTGQMIDPAQPVQVAMLVPAGTGSADLDWLARSLTNSARMAVSDARGATIDLRIYEAGADPAQVRDDPRQLAGQFGQLLRAEDDDGERHQDDELRSVEIHAAPPASP